MNVAGTTVQEQPGPSSSPSYIIVLVCVWLTVVIAALPFIGWLFEKDILTRFVAHGRPTWPLTSVGYITLAFSLRATAMKRERLAFGLVIVPAALALVALAEHALNTGSALDRLLLPNQIRRVNSPLPGRPGYYAAITFLLLTAGIALANLKGARSGKILSILASLTLGVGTLSASLILQGVRELYSEWSPLIGSLPPALCSATLSIGLLARTAETGWRDLINSEAPEWRVFRLAFPVVLTAPTLISTLQFWLLRSRALPELPPEFLGVALNMAVVGGLLFWSSTMLVRGRAAFEEMSSALDSAAVALTDLDGRILHWSQGCEDLYGWTAEEAVGRRKRELVAPGTFQEDYAAPGENKERTAVHRDGRQLRVLQQVRRLERWGKDPVLVVSMIDITDRARAEHALRESETRLAMALDAHEIGIFEWDARNDIIRWSAGAEERLGLQPGSMHDYESWQKLVHPDDIAALNDIIAKAIEAKAPRFSFRFRFNQPDGKVRSMEGSSRAFYDENGDLIRTIGVNVDVTERDEREAQLQAREAQLISILQTVPDAMVVIDETGHILSFSRTAEQLFGYPAAEVIGRNVSMLTPDEHAGQHDAYLDHYLATGEKRVIGRTRLLTARAANGREIPIELRVGEAITAGERLFTGFIRDISQRLDNEERLNTLRSELTHVSRLGAMGEMGAGLAHELNQPLAASVNYVATASLLLKEGSDTQQVEKMLEEARSQALRAGEIIRRLRDFVARHDTEVRAEPVEETVRDAMALVLVGQKQLRVNVRYNLDPDAALMFADRVQVQQVLVNLLRNAVEAMRDAETPDMTIVVQTRVLDPETIEIAVSDNGPGLASGYLDQMYTPFSSTKGEAGMGIGLSICRRIIESHGGELTGENLAEGGAKFRFTLPMINERELDLS